MTLTPLFPVQPVPALKISTVGGQDWELHAEHGKNFTMVVFYRGLHCPICGGYLQDLNRKLAKFEERGISVVAISSDTEDRATEAKRRWKITDLTIGYGLGLQEARQWGLYLSRGHGETSAGMHEPSLFSEPALYIIRPDGTLYFGTSQTMPFARPNFDDIITGIDFVLAKNYPARGEVTNDEF